ARPTDRWTTRYAKRKRSSRRSTTSAPSAIGSPSSSSAAAPWRTPPPWPRRSRTSCSWRRSACAPCSSTAAASRSTAPWPPPRPGPSPAPGREPRSPQPLRYPAPATLDIVARVLLHEINADLVRRIRQLGGRAVALHSGSTQALFGEKLLLPGADGKPIDLGLVGRVTRVDARLIEDFCAGGVVPVIPSLALAEGGGWLNVNADTAAAAVAAPLPAPTLASLPDTPGALGAGRAPASLVRTLDASGCRDLIQRGVIDEGMIPKVEACVESLRSGVRQTHMIDGRLRHSLL